MLLTVNLGNSNMRFGAFKSDEDIVSWIIPTKPYRTEDACFEEFEGMYEAFGLKKEDITQIVIGSVVPPMTGAVVNSLKRIHKIEPKLVDRNTPSGVKHQSNQMGTDLYANAVAAHELYKGKKIIIDFGTALTFTGIDEKGETLGVVIAPGIKTALKSLIEETAQLPEIELKAPEKVLGRNTVSCMQSGMVYGFTSFVEGMIDRINKEVKDDCFVVATGGMSFVYAPLTDKIHIQDALHTIKGLRFLSK